MSKKRTATEANDEEGTNEVPQNEESVKRAKLTPLNDKTLQDLPNRLLERILVEAVVKEVRSMKLAKSVWKEKADLVIRRLTTVCLQWSNILTAYRFLTKVHRILDGTAQETIRLEVVHQSRFQNEVDAFATLKEEIFLHRSTDDGHTPIVIEVYERSNMAEVIDVIALPGEHQILLNIEACNVSDCVYVLCQHTNGSNEFYQSVLRIKKDGEHRYKSSPWISVPRQQVSSISVLRNGILSVTHGLNPVALRNYDANGTLVLSADIYGFRYYVDRVMQKANGDLVLGTICPVRNLRVLTEIYMDGKVKWQHVSSILFGRVHFADTFDRILVTDQFGGMELLDSELNLLVFDRQQLSAQECIDLSDYNNERNDVVAICYNRFTYASCLTFTVYTFRFKEE